MSMPPLGGERERLPRVVPWELFGLTRRVPYDVVVHRLFQRNLKKFEREDRFTRDFDMRVDQRLNLVLIEFLVILLIPCQP